MSNAQALLTPAGTVGGTDTYGNATMTLQKFFPGAIFSRNVLQGADAGVYPPSNFFPATMGDVHFVDLSGGNYRLQQGSPYKNAAADGKDIGADIDVLESAIRPPAVRVHAVRHAP